MATPAEKLTDIESSGTTSKFSVYLATDEAQRLRCYQLRYNVFANEMGATIRGDIPGIDKDEFDDVCQHLIVRDNSTGEIVATTRLLDNEGRKLTGSFYSETEFDLKNIIHSNHRFMEVGRTCIHPDYRRGAALAMLWQGIAQIVNQQKIEYLIGCASIQLSNGDAYLRGVMQMIRAQHYSPEHLRVRPLVPMRLEDAEPQTQNVILPTLLKGYLRQGALICGEPYLDLEFGVADVFVLLDCKHIARRYTRHFLDRQAS